MLKTSIRNDTRRTKLSCYLTLVHFETECSNLLNINDLKKAWRDLGCLCAHTAKHTARYTLGPFRHPLVARLQTRMDHTMAMIPEHKLAKTMAQKMPTMPNSRLPT